jgi:hypothetical protein
MAGLGNASPEYGSHGQIDVALELGFGDPWGLEILPVEIGDASFAQQVEGPAAAAERRGHAQASDLGEDIRPEHRAVPCDRRTPVVAHNHRLLFPEGCDQRDDVADVVEDAVGVDVGGRAGFAKAAHVRCDNAKVGRRQRGQLMPP